jgi:GNAT superfamily N-acetyltransferase
MLEIRPIETDDDLHAALELVRNVYPERALTLAEFRGHQAAYEDHALLQALDAGRLVGWSVMVAEPRLRAQKTATAEIVVAPDARRRGTGTQLYRALSDWARSQGLDRLEGRVKEGEDDSLRWVERRGFAETGRESRLELDLTGIDPPEVDPPVGIEIVTWGERPELIEGMYEVSCEASPDIPGAEDEKLDTFEDWLAYEMTGPGDRPEATFAALANDEVVGYAKFSLTDAQPATAYHDLTGVKRAWRGRGIAGALKRTQIRWAKENGYELLSTMNEERNAAIRKLNERYGYRLAPGRIFVRGPLAP